MITRLSEIHRLNVDLVECRRLVLFAIRRANEELLASWR